MPFAVTLRLDAAAAARLQAVRDVLAERDISGNARRPSYPPHPSRRSAPCYKAA